MPVAFSLSQRVSRSNLFVRCFSTPRDKNRRFDYSRKQERERGYFKLIEKVNIKHHRTKDHMEFVISAFKLSSKVILIFARKTETSN